MSKAKKSLYVDDSPEVTCEPIGGTAAQTGGDGDGEAQKEKETKREKFLRLALRRIPRAEKAILQVANLFRRAQYDCEERHLTATEKKLQKALDQFRANFASVKPKAPVEELFPEDNPPQRSA